mgnify:CR=1 FL=1
MRRPITIEFKDTPIRQVFEVLARTSGLNFVFDREVKPDIKVTLSVANLGIDDVVLGLGAAERGAPSPLTPSHAPILRRPASPSPRVHGYADAHTTPTRSSPGPAHAAARRSSASGSASGAGAHHGLLLGMQGGAREQKEERPGNGHPLPTRGSRRIHRGGWLNP